VFCTSVKGAFIYRGLWLGTNGGVFITSLVGRIIMVVVVVVMVMNAPSGVSLGVK
jgi:cell division protein FtsX